MDKKSCVIYDSWGELLYNLPNEMAGVLIKEIISYAFDMEPMPDVDPAIGAMFAMIKTKLDEDFEAYKETKRQRAEAGKRGMESRWNNKTITNNNDVITSDNTVTEGITNITVSESVSDSVYVSESDSVSVYDSDKNKKHIYGEYKHVRLTDKERDQLFNDYGEPETTKAIRYLDEYIEMKGAKYKSHYLALRKWVFDAIKNDKPPNRETIFDAWAKA